jgi:hypothetical protein
MRRNAELLGVRAPVWAFVVLGAASIFVATQLSPDRGREESFTVVNHVHTAAVNRPLVRHRPASFVYINDLADRQKATILQRLSDPDPQVRLKTLEQIEALDLPGSERVPLLIGCLADADSRVRALAATRLGFLSMTASDAVPALKQLVQTDTDELVRSRAKDALYNIRLYDYSNMMRDIVAD